MIKRWIQATLITLGLAAQAHAQMPPPQGGGPMYPPTFANNAAPMGGAQFCPAPEGCSGGPPAKDADPFSLPRDGSPNAWDENCPGGCRQGQYFYVHIGAMGLTRQGLGNGVLGVKDPGVNIPGIPSNVDTGNLPPIGSPTLVDLNNLSPDMQAGFRASVGWREGDHAFEISGFIFGTQKTTSLVGAPGMIDLPFGLFPAPIGFQGDNNLWLQADTVQQQLVTRLASVEANYRYSTIPGFEFLFGVRYVDYQENYSLMTLDDNLVVQPVNPTQIATLFSQVHNRVIGPQLGFEYECRLLDWFALGLNGKAMLGANFMDRDYYLQRGDGFMGPNSHISQTLFSQVYELNAFADFAFSEQCKLRLGYVALWLTDMPLATQQINFNPASAVGIGDNHGAVFFHGPMLEFQISF